jgi:hypothetical protein
MDETPEIQPDAVRIEPVELLKPTIPAPDMMLKTVVLPQSVIDAVEMHHQRMKEAELNRLQKMYADGKLTEEEIRLLVQANIIQQPTNIFQLLKDNSMNAFIAMIWSFVKTNLRTSITGLVLVVSQVCVKFGLEIPPSFSDTIFGIAYVFIFNLADRQISPQWIAGAVLTVLSLFLTPLATFLGFAANPFIMTSIQLGMQQLVALLLKDQADLQNIARRTGALPASIIIFLLIASGYRQYEPALPQIKTNLLCLRRTLPSSDYKPHSNSDSRRATNAVLRHTGNCSRS